MEFRIGHGYDIHRLAHGNDLYICGVQIEHSKGLVGHSDADVALHALCDSLLGAAGLKDIGFYFPNSDPEFKGIRSTKLLRQVVSKITELGWAVSNIDISIIAEEPKLSGYISEMKKTLSEILTIEESRIGIKATTNEGVDQIGQGDAICAHAVCLLRGG